MLIVVEFRHILSRFSSSNASCLEHFRINKKEGVPKVKFGTPSPAKISSLGFSVYRCFLEQIVGKGKPPDLQTTFGKPRSRNLLKPRLFFLSPNTGSGSIIRLTARAYPSSLRSFCLAWFFSRKYFMLTLISPGKHPYCGHCTSYSISIVESL